MPAGADRSGSPLAGGVARLAGRIREGDLAGFRIDCAGEAEVVFMGYREGESPTERPPEILLIRPNETPICDFFNGMFWENLGLLTIVSHLEQQGVRLGVLEASLFQCTPQQTATLAIDTGAPLVGIAVFATDVLESALDLARRVKAARPAVKVVLGGHGVSFVPGEVLAHNEAVDFVISGEGEESLLRLVRGLDDQAAVAAIPNLASREPGGAIRVNPVTLFHRRLDDAPLPHRFARDLMHRDPVLSRTPLMFVSSKGCFDKCAFCTITQFYATAWRGRSPRHVVDEVEALVRRYSARSFHFWDDCFTGTGKMGRQRAMGIAQELIDRRLDVVFHITTRPTDLDEELVATLAQAGLRSVFLGVESSQQEVLDHFQKHAKVEHSTRAAEMLWRHGVHRIMTGFILFHPLATWDTVRADLAFLRGFPYVEFGRIRSRLLFHPGSAFYREHRDTLGSDAYKRDFTPPLSSPAMERLSTVCRYFDRCTMRLECVISELEERFLPDSTVVARLAGVRREFFAFIVDRVLGVVDALEEGRDDRELVRVLGQEIVQESLRRLQHLHREFAHADFEFLLRAHRLLDYDRLIEPCPPREDVVAAAGG